MSRRPPRRSVLRGLAAAGTAVIGFDPFTRSWAVTPSDRPLHGIPDLDGTLHTDEASLSAAADDFGHIVHRRPAAVLRPGSVADVVAMVRFCDRRGIPVAPRGQGHATNGQAQVAGGLVIETAPLAAIQPLGPGSTGVRVGAGAKWSDVAKATLAHGLTPPVFTDYLELSVGGTLSVGGLGGQTHRHGAQVDNVLELEVVTGAGELLRCSPTRHRDLFLAVLAGLGQCAVVVGATVRLVRAPETVRHYLLPYDDLRTFVEDQRLLVRDRRFSYVEGQIVPDATGAFRGYVIEAVAYGPPAGDVPDDTALLRGLRHDPSGAEITDMPYYDLPRPARPGRRRPQGSRAVGVRPSMAQPARARPEGCRGDRAAPGRAHPGRRGPGRCGAAVPAGARAPADPAAAHARRPRALPLRGPADHPPDDTASVRRLLAANRSAYDLVRAAGGTQYPVGSVPFERADWRRHFGSAWPRFAAARKTYDPRGNLVPGQGIF
jgi:cytokinin dehydrogenase